MNQKFKFDFLVIYFNENTLTINIENTIVNEFATLFYGTDISVYEPTSINYNRFL